MTESIKTPFITVKNPSEAIEFYKTFFNARVRILLNILMEMEKNNCSCGIRFWKWFFTAGSSESDL